MIGQNLAGTSYSGERFSQNIGTKPPKSLLKCAICKRQLSEKNITFFLQRLYKRTSDDDTSDICLGQYSTVLAILLTISRLRRFRLPFSCGRPFGE